MSAILSADDLNDFISPGVACIKPVESLGTPSVAQTSVKLHALSFNVPEYLLRQLADSCLHRIRMKSRQKTKHLQRILLQLRSHLQTVSPVQAALPPLKQS